MRHHLSARVLALATGAATLLATALAAPADARGRGNTVEWWVTDLTTNQRLEQQDALRMRRASGRVNDTTVVIDPNRRYQKMIGWGASMTESSSYVLSENLTRSTRNEVMTKLFSPTEGIGLSAVRVPMGASDFAVGRQWSYDDVPAGQTDTDLSEFSIRKDRANTIPRLKQAEKLNPRLRLMASPWSPPGWMKTSDNMTGGTLKPEYYGVYARYFVRFLKAYAAAGVHIDDVTVQNEPLYSPADYPGMNFPAEEAATFIGRHLGPRIAASGLGTKIWGYDHNWDVRSYPESLYTSVAAPYVVGTAWHCYGGDISAQSLSHNAFPDRQAQLSECSGGEWQGTQAQAFEQTMGNVIGNPRNWGQAIVLWNLALDEKNGPYIGGCMTCRGVVTAKTDGSYELELEYWALGHASKFVHPGATRIGSSIPTGAPIQNVAFQNRDGSQVLVAYNDGDTAKSFKVRIGNRTFSAELAGRAAATFTWKGVSVSRNSHPDLGYVDLPLGGSTGTAVGRRQQSVSPELVAQFNQVGNGSGWLGYSLPYGGEVNPGLSYTRLPRTGWTATAVSEDTQWGNAEASNMLDGDPATRWSSGHGLTPGDWIQIDLGAPTTFDQVILDSQASPTDYPRTMVIEVSDDATTWRPIFRGAGAQSVSTMSVPSTTARYIKVTNTSSSGSWWSVHEFHLGVASGTPDATTGRANLIRSTRWLSDGTRVRAVYNAGTTTAVSRIRLADGTYLTYSLPAKGAATFAWLE